MSQFRELSDDEKIEEGDYLENSYGERSSLDPYFFGFTAKMFSKSTSCVVRKVEEKSAA